ncbi:LysR family transcriptional regulator [Nannocystis bainbridge]|uniref:LysR family transcriptional regulator n=1 Tax=Nannocystis bainbridge TaxID=2995303 RepID=A0ABT5E3I3_9BACT|nr:LysR family transcriptional regulator [Nannocystis bainbridge]MDC0720431.1 LysR family transcriptional regulator [Nannocystis bainbridge]
MKLIVVMSAMNLVHTSGIDLGHLRVLDVLLRTHSTVRAARELGLTQSAISHALRRLRAALGDPLFVRVGRKLAPTERVLALRGPLAEALAAVGRVFQAGEGFAPATLKASFRIIAADYAELVVLPRLLTALACEAPGIDVVTQIVGDAVEDVVQRGEADLALGASFSERGGLMLRPLLRDPFVVAIAAEHAPGRLTLERYLAARHVLVAPRALPGGVVDNHLASLGRARRVVLRTPCFQTALAIAARTDLLVTAPRSLVTEYVRHAPLVTFAPPLELPEVRFGLLYAASRQDDVAHKWLRERVAALFPTKPQRRR